MSVKQRIRAAEKNAGLGSDVQIIIYRTFYEAKDGKGRVLRKDGEAEGHFRASIGGPKQSQSHIGVSSVNDEKYKDFEARVETECLRVFGKLPRNWHRDKAEAAV